MAIAATIPLLYPQIPPLTDVMGHMGRYRVELDIGTSPYLHQWFSFRWAIIGNLGVDLLIVPVAKLFGLELGVKLIVMTIPALTVAGMLLIAREVHGRVPPTLAFAFPLAYGFPFQFGFINYCLSMALALLAFGLWLRLGRLGRIGLRAWLFVPIGGLIWLTHSYGWGVLGLLAFASEVSQRLQAREGLVKAVWHGGLACLPLAPPMLLMLAWRDENVAGSTKDFMNWEAKKAWALAVLRERDQLFDLISSAMLFMLIIASLFRLRLRMNATIGASALALLVAYLLLLPRILLGSAYADMRLAPYMLAVALIGISARRIDRRGRMILAVCAVAFYGSRLTSSTISFADRDAAYRDQLSALDHVPRGSRVFALVDLPCNSRWWMPRTEHLGAMGIVRRDAFVNGQWDMPGAQLLRVTYRAAGPFGVDPSQIVRPPRCFRGLSMDERIAAFPRAAFDYLWLIDLPPAHWPHEPDLIPVWHGRQVGVLYRLARSATTPSDTPTGSRPRATT